MKIDDIDVNKIMPLATALGIADHTPPEQKEEPEAEPAPESKKKVVPKKATDDKLKGTLEKDLKKLAKEPKSKKRETAMKTIEDKLVELEKQASAKNK